MKTSCEGGERRFRQHRKLNTVTGNETFICFSLRIQVNVFFISLKGGCQMNYEQFREQMKDDLTARFARDLPPELADVRIGIRDVEKLQGESYRGISFRSGDSPVEANLNMTGVFQAYEAGRPYEESTLGKS